VKGIVLIMYNAITLAASGVPPFVLFVPSAHIQRDSPGGSTRSWIK